MLNTLKDIIVLYCSIEGTFAQTQTQTHAWKHSDVNAMQMLNTLLLEMQQNDSLASRNFWTPSVFWLIAAHAQIMPTQLYE